MRRGRSRRWSRVVACSVAVLVGVPLGAVTAATTAQIAGASISTYAAPADSEFGIAKGPDGAVWFTNFFLNSISRITTSGAATTFNDPSIDGPISITAGPDGALWFTNRSNNSIGRITTSGTVSNFTDPTISVPQGIVPGPDGALWFANTGNSSIGRITTSGTVTNFTGAGINGPDDIAKGSDGALWFVNAGAGGPAIGRITTTGAVTSYADPIVSGAAAIAAGPDGALWYVNYASSLVGRVTTAGAVTDFTDPGIDLPQDIAAGPDGALWIANVGGFMITRITTSGTVTSYPSNSGEVSVTEGPDGAMWFGNGGSITRFTPPSPTDTCTTSRSCVTANNVVASSASPAETVTVSGKPDQGTGKVKVTFASGSLSCPNTLAGASPVGQLVDSGYSAKARLTVTIRLHYTTETKAAQVCFHSKVPFKSQSSATSKAGGGTGLLLTCTAAHNVAPCVSSVKQVGTDIGSDVVVTFVAPGGDPGFQIPRQVGQVGRNTAPPARSESRTPRGSGLSTGRGITG